jgi:hypothetical protein
MGQETTVTGERPCPCGKGSIVTTLTEFDNGYSGDMVSTHMACPVCHAAAVEKAAASAKLWVRQQDLKKIIHRDYCLPVVARLIALARANERPGAKRKGWHAALSPWADALKLPPADGTWKLETFVRDNVKFANVAAIANDLGLAAGLDAHFAELAELDVRLGYPRGCWMSTLS